MIGDFIPFIKTSIITDYLSRMYDIRKQAIGFENKIPTLNQYAKQIFSVPPTRPVLKEMKRPNVPTSYLTLLTYEAEFLVREIKKIKHGASYYGKYQTQLTELMDELKQLSKEADDTFSKKSYNGKEIPSYDLSTAIMQQARVVEVKRK